MKWTDIEIYNEWAECRDEDDKRILMRRIRNDLNAVHETELARLRSQVAELSVRAADAEEAAGVHSWTVGEQAATIDRLRVENEALAAWAKRAYVAMCRYDESLMVSCVADAPPRAQGEES